MGLLGVLGGECCPVGSNFCVTYVLEALFEVGIVSATFGLEGGVEEVSVVFGNGGDQLWAGWWGCETYISG